MNLDSPEMLKKSMPLIIVVVGIAVVVLLAKMLPGRDRPMPEPSAMVVSVTVQTIATRDLIDTFAQHGVVEPNKTIKLASEVDGQIIAYGKRASGARNGGLEHPAGEQIAEGELITKGDPIILLDTGILQADFDRAKAQADFDKREYERMQTLFDRQVATRTELDQCITRAEISKASMASSAERLEKATIVAPISGVLNDLPEEIGHFVQPGNYVAEIVDIRTVKVVVDVPEKDVHYLKVGDTVEVIADSRGEMKMAGKITFISEIADERARTTRVEVAMDNKDRKLRSGQIVRVVLTRRVLKDIIMIPLKTAIPIEKAGKTEYVVYIVENGKAVKRIVDMGLFKGISRRVLGGLEVGDKLIIEGHRYVGPGHPVRIIPNEPATKPADQPSEFQG